MSPSTSTRRENDPPAATSANVRRAANAVVILRAAIDAVERRVVIHSHVVELGDGKVADEFPVRAAVKALVDSAVAAGEQVLRVRRIDPERVIVDVLLRFAKRPERPPAVTEPDTAPQT